MLRISISPSNRETPCLICKFCTFNITVFVQLYKVYKILNLGVLFYKICAIIMSHWMFPVWHLFFCLLKIYLSEGVFIMRTNTIARTLAFSETKTLFRDFLNGKTNYEYDEWKHLSADCKSVALYLNFYDTIMAALYRARQHKPIPGDDTDLVSVATEKCQRIVEVLDTQPEKYTKGYVSLVMYNAFAVTLSQLVSSKQKLFNTFACENFSSMSDAFEISEEVNYNLVDQRAGIQYHLDINRIMQITDSQPKYVQEIIEKLINGGKLGKKQQQIIPYLREIFAEFAPECAESVL